MQCPLIILAVLEQLVLLSPVDHECVAVSSLVAVQFAGVCSWLSSEGM